MNSILLAFGIVYVSVLIFLPPPQVCPFILNLNLVISDECKIIEPHIVALEASQIVTDDTGEC